MSLQRWYNNEKRLSVLRRTAQEVRSYKVQTKVLSALLACIVSLTAIFYIGAALYKNTGSFTVGVDKVDLTKYGLTLAGTQDMAYNTSHLSAKINERITNISRDDIPANVDSIDGEHNGDNYIAFTFYVQNTGEEAVSYEYELTISGVTKGLDEAVHVRLYYNGSMTEYAKTASDGSGPEPGTTEFYSLGVVTKGRVDNFAQSAIDKYTIVIWLEGDDPDCVDRVIDGLAKFEMIIRVAH